ncbi:AraC family transcriptional regulator [Actinoplanes sp. NPDC049548]|uniref:AraC family transcriptional regulator n=1 Tax=Actinoplanes sp. NPDC049548 TaxID=3155152 RepID=UPI0034329D5D
MRTSELDELRSFLDPQFYRSTARIVDRSQSLDAHFDVVRAGPVTIGVGRFGADLDVSMRGIDAFHVNVPSSGWLRRHQDRADPVVVPPGDAVLYQPGERVHDRWSGDCSALSIKIEAAALRAQLAGMLDAPVTSPLRLGSRLEVAQGPGLTWLRLVRLLAGDARDPRGLVHHPLVRDRLVEMMLAGLVMSTSHRHREDLDRPPRRVTATGPVRRVVDAIRSHPESPYTLGTLADIAGVGRRTLQAAFQRQVGTSPMRYLRDVRLARAHADLCGESPATVASVAYTWGFTHLGRFAALYRARYGTVPSQHRREGAAPATER